MPTLHIEVTFKNTLSSRAEQDVKDAIQDFKEAIAYLAGTVTRADLVQSGAQPTPSEGPKETR